MKRAIAIAGVIVAIGCGRGNEAGAGEDASASAGAGAGAGAGASASASAIPSASAAGLEVDAAAPPCPADMRFVQGTFCREVERTCLLEEPNGANHITLCHAFARETRCASGEEERAFCMDEFEYPNERGAHPPWMITWYDAQATCESKGKRLCYESEWTMACEGPDKTPFPYGWERDHDACNSDNAWIPPSLERMYATDPPDAGDAAVQAPELARLDQSVPSGAYDRCVSGYGVRDMTGNFDEWVVHDEPTPPAGPDKGLWAALKGGAWGHVRNACRPVTTSHSPGWTYYFVSFRCCADAKGYPAYELPRGAMKPPKVKPEDKAPRIVVTNAAGPSKVKIAAPKAKAR